MITLAKEFTMNRQSRNYDGRLTDLCGSAPEQPGPGRVRCFLEVGGLSLPLDVPAEVLERRALVPAELVLRVPGEGLLPIQAKPRLTEAQQQSADRWIAEMEDFDRF